MKKPRTLTPDEVTLWRESNRETTRTKRFVARVESVTTETTPPIPRVTSAPAPTLAPPPKATAKLSPSALPALSQREATKRFKQHHAIEARLDLHGLTKVEAYAQVTRFITRQHRAGHRHVIIITGKGRGNAVGVLRANLPDWLNEPPLRALISTVTHARPEKGGDGVTHVLLKRL